MTARKKAAAAEAAAPAEMTASKFWMVHGLGRGAPVHRHMTKQSAADEAQRLALQSPGALFFVLAAIDAYCAQITPVQPVKLTAPPRPERTPTTKSPSDPPTERHP